MQSKKTLFFMSNVFVLNPLLKNNLYLVMSFQFKGKPIHLSNSVSPNRLLFFIYLTIISASIFLNTRKSSFGSKYLNAMTKLNKSLFHKCTVLQFGGFLVFYVLPYLVCQNVHRKKTAVHYGHTYF